MKISIIVPVYNTATYLATCLDSLLGQTYKDYEIILIDDCSTDVSPLLCDQYSQNNPLIKVFHSLANKGVSAARNKGVDIARGDYITFVDSDDFVADDFLENLCEGIDDDDMVLSGLVYFKSQNDFYMKEVLSRQKWTFDKKSQYLQFLQQPLVTSPVAKLYKTNVIKQFELKFDESMSLGEDRDFNIRYLRKMNSAYSVDYVGYFYRRDVENSLTKKIHLDAFKNDILYWNQLHELLGGVGEGYQSHRLFNFIVDNMAEIGKERGWMQAYGEIRKLKPIINTDYLKRNLDKVDAPIWQKLMTKVCL